MQSRRHFTELELSAIPKTVQIDLCVMAITKTAEAMTSPEGREAINRGKQEYLRHLAERERSDAGRNQFPAIEPQQKTIRKETA